MAVVILPSRQTRQPQYPARADLGHPFAPGLTTLLMPRWRVNAVDGQVRAVAAGAFATETRRNGQAAVADNTTDQMVLVPAAKLGLSANTIFMAYRKTDSTNRASVAWAVVDSPSRLNTHLPYSDGTTYFDHGNHAAAGGRLSVSGLTFGDDLWCFSAGPRGLEIWQNGFLRAAYTGGAASARTATGDNLIWNGTSSGSAGDLAAMSLFMHWTVQLPTSAIKSLFTNPWQLFKPLRRRLYIVTGTGAVTLTVADAGHGHSVDNIALRQANTLAVADALHGHSVDAPALTQAHVLAVAEALHAHAVEQVALTQANTLTVADAAHAHSADAVVLVQAHILAVADALHAHAAESSALTQANALAMVDALHAHAADNVTLSAGDTLTVSEATHAHSADSVNLTQANVLVVQESAHGHTVDSVALSFGVTLAIAEALHAHAVDAVALTQAHVLTVQDALHGHTADAAALTQANVLIVSDALHAQIADAITLRMPGVIGASTLFVVAAGERILVVAHSQRYFTVH